MKRLLPWLLLGAPVHAQPWPVRIDVVDRHGRPITGASVYYAYRDNRVLTTGPNGKVDIETEAQRIAISKYGYLTVLFSRSEQKKDSRVVVPLQHVLFPPTCNFTGRSPDWPPEIVPNGTAPKASEVWAAFYYQQTALLLNGRFAIDTKITAASGRLSRYFGNAEESLSYVAVDDATSRKLDDLIRQACYTQVSAIVVDQHGRPLDGVTVSPFREFPQHTAQIDADGTFDGQTVSPHIVFRRVGYQTVVAKPAANLRIVMYPAGPPRFKTCPGGPSRDIFQTFRFSEEHHAHPFQDIDYYGGTYAVNTSSGQHFLRHGSGPNWSYGLPELHLIAPSNHYEERNYVFGNIQITNANGIFADGTRWRFLGRFGETAEYQSKDPETAKKLDAILDSVCLMSMPSAPPQPGK